jgi:hypothetical protein
MRDRGHVPASRHPIETPVRESRQQNTCDLAQHLARVGAAHKQDLGGNAFEGAGVDRLRACIPLVLGAHAI